MFARRVSVRISPALVVTGSGALSVLARMSTIGKIPPTFAVHTSQNELMDLPYMMEGSNADNVMPHVLGMKWDDERRRWVPLVEGAGEGAGKDPREGARFLEAGKNELIEDFSRFLEAAESLTGERPNIVFFLNSLGGGTGSALVNLESVLSKIPNPPRFVNVYTYPSSMEPSDAHSRAIRALRSVNQESSAILVNYNHILEDLANPTLGRVYETAAERIAHIVYGLLELFMHPDKVTQRADVKDILTATRPPFAIMMRSNLSFYNPMELKSSATAWPREDPSPGERTMFIGYKRDPDTAATSVMSVIETEFGVTKTIVHAVTLGRNEAIILVSPFRLEDLLRGM